MKQNLFLFAFVFFSQLTLARTCYESFVAHKKFPSEKEVAQHAEICIEKLSEKISAGSLQAINEGAKIRHYTDAGDSLTIRLSLATALPKQPLAVISAIGDDLPYIRAVCSMGFIEPENAFLKKYYKQTSTAIKSISGWENNTLVVACGNELDRTAKKLRLMYGFVAQTPSRHE